MDDYSSLHLPLPSPTSTDSPPRSPSPSPPSSPPPTGSIRPISTIPTIFPHPTRFYFNAPITLPSQDNPYPAQMNSYSVYHPPTPPPGRKVHFNVCEPKRVSFAIFDRSGAPSPESLYRDGEQNMDDNDINNNNGSDSDDDNQDASSSSSSMTYATTTQNIRISIAEANILSKAELEFQYHQSGYRYQSPPVVSKPLRHLRHVKFANAIPLHHANILSKREQDLLAAQQDAANRSEEREQKERSGSEKLPTKKNPFEIHLKHRFGPLLQYFESCGGYYRAMGKDWDAYMRSARRSYLKGLMRRMRERARNGYHSYPDEADAVNGKAGEEKGDNSVWEADYPLLLDLQRHYAIPSLLNRGQERLLALKTRVSSILYYGLDIPTPFTAEENEATTPGESYGKKEQRELKIYWNVCEELYSELHGETMELVQVLELIKRLMSTECGRREDRNRDEGCGCWAIEA